jgi:uncharacterized protein YfaS (alpha-2-macroglobulin family)
VKFRSDFRETAFFYPELRTNQNGEISLEFTMPDALTRWNLIGLSHTKDLMTGSFRKEIVTRKDLMIFPNMPRYVREGDTIRLDVKIATDKDNMIGTATLEIFDAITMKPVDKLIFGELDFRSFTCSRGKDALVGWRIHIPSGIQALTFKIMATAGNFSDGEEISLPVLSNRILVTESLPLPVNGNSTKSFTFNHLKNPGSKTLSSQKLILEFTSNPAWYAIQALPFIMESDRESAEEIFNKLFANGVGSFILMSDPKIQKVFESWKSFSPSALISNLEKNDELKGISLQETPWVMDGKNESERKQRVARLFDFNRMEVEQEQALLKLTRLQLPGGAWPWFPGLPESRFITQYIVTGLGRMDKMGLTRIRNDKDGFGMLVKACNYLDRMSTEDYNQQLRLNPSKMAENHLEPAVIQYLYARSFLFKDIPIAQQDQKAFDYYLKQAGTFWNTFNPYMQAMMAISLHRFGNNKAADDIVRSLSEKALHSEEMGMYWRDIQGFSWYQNPIQAQALLIEAFDEIRSDVKSVDEMKRWLLKQKQTQDWKSTVATADACYALLRKGTDFLQNTTLADISLGGKQLDPAYSSDTQVEAGTGYLKTSWNSGDIKPEMADVKVVNPNSGPAWGALYWQYFEDIDKVQAKQSPLSVQKQCFLELNSDAGPILTPIDNQTIVRTGAKIVVRLILKSDRDLDFVHLKDLRAAGLEPLNVLSGYKYQDGLSYYEVTKDAATNFYFPDLRKGTYVFEYQLVASMKGAFSNGMASVQCLYAPEFTAHSGGIRLNIQ